MANLILLHGFMGKEQLDFRNFAKMNHKLVKSIAAKKSAYNIVLFLNQVQRLREEFIIEI